MQRKKDHTSKFAKGLRSIYRAVADELTEIYQNAEDLTAQTSKLVRAHAIVGGNKGHRDTRHAVKTHLEDYRR